MNRATLISLLGTDEVPSSPTWLTAGPLAVALAAGSVRAVHWHGVEVLRGLDYPVRDADWGTYPQVTQDERFSSDATSFRYERTFSAADGAIDGVFVLEGSGNRLTARVDLRPVRTVTVNRAGFVVLHPVAGVAGSPLTVRHADGSVEQTTFPERISPSQPVFDIAALTQNANGVTAEIVFAGETFEMEDQRNWSDASYKTYCRPLALPFPYVIGPDDPVSQTITLTFSGEGKTAGGDADAGLRTAGATGTMPEVTLSLEAGWEAEGPAIDALDAAATRVRIDATREGWRETLVRLVARARGAIDLEIVTPDMPDAMDAALGAVAAAMETAGAGPRMVAALPAAYLKSYQPDGQWPTGASPSDAAAAARRHFPGALIMGGVLTNFTELNRHRAAATSGDVLTHGTTAIVHAADDVSVIQTLEALRQIFGSAAALAPGKPYHLGLVSIGMRSNPYGSGLARNPDGVRRPMADADPRQRGLFAAAWMVGAMAATEGSAVSGLSLAAPAGPMGLVEGETVRPVYHVFRRLAALVGAERLAVEAPAGVAAVAAREGTRTALVIANLTAEARTLDIDCAALTLPAEPVAFDWLDTATPERAVQVALGPYGVVLAWIDEENAA